MFINDLLKNAVHYAGHAIGSTMNGIGLVAWGVKRTFLYTAVNIGTVGMEAAGFAATAYLSKYALEIALNKQEKGRDRLKWGAIGVLSAGVSAMSFLSLLPHLKCTLTGNNCDPNYLPRDRDHRPTNDF